MKERIQKIIAARGLSSRRAAEEMIRDGRVSCNGIICSLGDCADPDIDRICVDGVEIPPESKKVYIILNKPRGFVTTMSDEKGRKDVTSLLEDCPTRVYPVGRLDMDSEGLLLFTNDGDVAYRLMHPKHEINKTYLVSVKNYSELALRKVKEPIILDGYKIRRPVVELKQQRDDQAVLSVLIHEGRNRQVRRMCAAAGMQVKRLIRISEGEIQLGDLAPGCWRYLTQCEIDHLKMQF